MSCANRWWVHGKLRTFNETQKHDTTLDNGQDGECGYCSVSLQMFSQSTELTMTYRSVSSHPPRWIACDPLKVRPQFFLFWNILCKGHAHTQLSHPPIFNLIIFPNLHKSLFGEATSSNSQLPVLRSDALFWSSEMPPRHIHKKNKRKL